MRPPGLPSCCALLLLASGCLLHERRSVGGFDPSTEVRRTAERPLELASGEQLEVELPAGELTVEVGTGQPALHAVLRVLAETREEAERVLAACEIRVERRSAGLALSLQEPAANPLGAKSWHASADLRLAVPEGVRTQLTTGLGAIALTGVCGDAQLRSGHGSVRVVGTRGRVEARTGSGAIEVAEVIGAGIELESSHGAIELRALEVPSLVARTGSGSIEGRALRSSSIELRTSHGSVELVDASGRITAATGSGRIVLRDVRGAIDARSSHGAISCDGVLEGLAAHAGSGAIEVCARTGSTVRADWELDSGFGEVRLIAPADLACELSAGTGYGDLAIGYPLTIEAGGLRSDARHLSGRIGAGGKRLTLASGSGDVRLECDGASPIRRPPPSAPASARSHP